MNKITYCNINKKTVADTGYDQIYIIYSGQVTNSFECTICTVHTVDTFLRHLFKYLKKFCSIIAHYRCLRCNQNLSLDLLYTNSTYSSSHNGILLSNSVFSLYFCFSFSFHSYSYKFNISKFIIFSLICLSLM